MKVIEYKAFVPDTAKCKGCRYWRRGGGDVDNGLKMCHHLLDTDKRRSVGVDGKCLSYYKLPDKPKPQSKRWRDVE